MCSVAQRVRRASVLVILAIGVFGAMPRHARAQDTSAVAPYIPDSAIAVMKIDLMRFDPVPLVTDVEQSLDKLQADSEPKALEKLRFDLKEIKSNLTKTRDSLVAAGGKELYVVLLFKFGGKTPIIFAVRTGPGAKTEELSTMMTKELIGTRDAVAVVGEGMIAGGSPEMLSGLPVKEPKRGEELARALAAAGDAPIQIALIPSELVRKAFVELVPELPAELGGGESSVVSDGVRWGSIAITPVPGGSIRLVLQSTAPASAASMTELIKKLLSPAVQDTSRLKNIPGIASIRQLLTPKAVNDRVELTLAGADFESMKNLLLPVMVRASKASLEMEKATRIRTLLQECYVYAQSHKDEFPPDLETLIKGGDGYLRPEMLRTDWNDPNSGPAYVYLKVPPEKQFLTDLVVIYERYKAWPKDGIWVGFADSHIERVTDEAKFKKMLEKK